MRHVVVALVAVVVAGACGTSGGGTGTADGRPRVVASFYPLFEAATRIAGGHAVVSNLTPAGSEPHDLELTTRQVDHIEDASVLLFLGRGFQPAIEKAAARAKGAKVDVLGELGSLLPAPAAGTQLTIDPHVWLDPRLFTAIVGRVAGALAGADPANRASYEANAGAYMRELDDLDSAFAQGLRSCDRRVMVTSHAAFAYLAARYGLTQEAVAGLAPESEPSPQRLASLAAKVRAEGTTTIFSETLVSPKVARALAREAGVTTAVLDPLEGLSGADAKAGKTYVSVMRQNLATIRTALGCR